MDKKLFGELVQSLKEAVAISKGKAKPSRVSVVEARSRARKPTKRTPSQ
jgi:hypothetical protein